MKKTLLILALCLVVNPICLAERSKEAPTKADVFLSNLSETWDSFLDLADETGQNITSWAEESGLRQWADDAIGGIQAWANDAGVTEWAGNALQSLADWTNGSGITEWTQSAAAELQNMIEKNRPEIEAWLARAGKTVAEAWNTLQNPEGHSDSEVKQAYETVVESLKEIS